MRNGQLNNGFSIFIQFFLKSSLHPLSTEKSLKDLSTYMRQTTTLLYRLLVK